MKTRLALVAAAVVAVSAAGVALGGTSIRTYVARAGEETGFSPQGQPGIYHSARAWLAYGGEKGQALKADVARLAREGFVAAVVQHMTYDAAPSHGGGLSLVVELGSRKDARDELLEQLREDIAGQSNVRHFTVPQLPDARGFTVSGNGSPAANLLFTEDRCLLLVGDEIPSGNDRGPVVAGANAIYRRTNGRCP